MLFLFLLANVQHLVQPENKKFIYMFCDCSVIILSQFTIFGTKKNILCFPGTLIACMYISLQDLRIISFSVNNITEKLRQVLTF